VSVTGLMLFTAFGLAAVAWWRLLKGKEVARGAAAKACRQHGLVLMDDTVMLASVQLRREDPVNAWGFRYTFDFARGGILHTGGIVLIGPGQRPVVVIEAEGGPLIEHL
jgi:hypothetical protein